MDKHDIKDKRITFRMGETEYDRITKDANECGMTPSSYIRERVSGTLQHIFFDPAMTAEMRAYRKDIQNLAKDITGIRQKVDADNYVQTAEIEKAQGILKSVYHKMSDVERCINSYREDLENGHNKTA